jgi:hypothetical protein
MTAASPFESLPGGWLAARRTLVLVGNLPVMNGLWLSQYADREARENGPVCLVRLAGDSVQIELFRAGARRPSIRPQARYEEALRAIAPVVSQWMIVPAHAESVDIPPGTDDVVVLTGADQPAIVAAYRLVKGAHEAIARAGGSQPSVSVAVLGADAQETANVAARIGDAAGASLHTTIPVRGGMQRVAPSESSFRGTFDDLAPSIGRIAEIIAGASQQASPPVAETADHALSDAPLRFAPRVERKAPVLRTAPDAIPFRSEFPPRGGRGMEPVRTPPARSAHVARDEAVRDEALRDEATRREILADASATLRAASASLREQGAAPAAVPGAGAAAKAPHEASRPPSPEPARELQYMSSYAASAVNGPSAAPPVARIVEGGMPESLVAFVQGLSRIDHVAPRCERIEFAIGEDGQLHLVCRVDDLRMLARARTWLGENASLFRRAFPEIASVDAPAVDVFVRDVRDIEPIDGATIRVIRQLEFAGRRCYDVQTLSA